MTANGEDGGGTATASRITDSLVAQIGNIADACVAAAVFVYADALDGRQLPLPKDFKHTVYYVTKTRIEQQEQEDRGTRYIRVPNVPFSRMGQAKMAIFLALSRNLISEGDVVVCLSGLTGSGTLDTVVVTEVGRELEMYSSAKAGDERPADVQPEVLERLLDIAAEIGREGREGKPVGAMFILGDSERALSMTRQLILNPFRGYPEGERNILSRDLEETIKELCTIDGAFVVRGNGVVESCGAFVKTASQEEYELPQGLGARHHAAAAITSVTDSLAVTVSESTGTVTVFRGGKIIVEIEKPRTSAKRPAGVEGASE